MKPLSILLLVWICIASVNTQDAEEIDLSKLRVKELKKMLEDRGVECLGCMEKEHLVQKVKESLSLPIVEKEVPKDTPKGEPIDPSSIDYEEVMKLFKNQEEEKKKTWEKIEELKKNNPEFAKRFNFKQAEEASFFSKPPKQEEDETKEEL